MTANLVDEHPEVQAVDGKLADLQRQKAEFEARAKKLADADEEAQRKYDEALRSALLEGTPPPPPLVLQLRGADVEIRQSFMLEQQLLNEERRQVVAAVYDEVLAHAREQVRELVKAARPTLEKLTAVMAEVGGLLAAVNTCRTARYSPNGSEGFRQFWDARLDVEAFVRLVATGGDPTSILDLPGAPPAVLSTGEGLIWSEVRQLIDGGIPHPVEESPVPEQPTPDRILGLAQPHEDPAQPDDDTPEQPVEDSRSRQRVRN
jgi:hypothetical protein